MCDACIYNLIVCSQTKQRSSRRCDAHLVRMNVLFLHVPPCAHWSASFYYRFVQLLVVETENTVVLFPLINKYKPAREDHHSW